MILGLRKPRDAGENNNKNILAKHTRVKKLTKRLKQNTRSSDLFFFSLALLASVHYYF